MKKLKYALLFVLIFAMASLTALAYEDGDLLVTTGERVNVRNSDSYDADRVAVLEPDAIAKYLDETVNQNGETWIYIELQDHTTGYVNSTFLKKYEGSDISDNGNNSNSNKNDDIIPIETNDEPAVYKDDHYEPLSDYGFREVYITVSGKEVNAWMRDDLIVFYGSSSDGTCRWYIYNLTDSSYSKLDSYNIEEIATNTKQDTDENVNKDSDEDSEIVEASETVESSGDTDNDSSKDSSGKKDSKDDSDVKEISISKIILIICILALSAGCIILAVLAFRKKSANVDKVAADLKKYKELLDQGLITQEEYNRKKKELME